LNYILFLRVTPTLPNTFINLASPIVDVPYHTFLLGTLIGLIPAAYVTVRVSFYLKIRCLSACCPALWVFLCVFVVLIPILLLFPLLSCIQAGIALGELTSLSDLYDTQSIALLFLIGVVSVTPALLGKDEAQEKPLEMAVGAS
jgi:hypothetical protein